MAGDAGAWILDLLGPFQELLCDLLRFLMFRSDQLEQPDSEQHRINILRLADQLAERAGAGIDLASFQASVALGGHATGPSVL